ncbi:MAG: heme exporter protein CcmD [Pseudomonadota bacterium]
MSDLLSDPYLAYVAMAYGASVLVIGLLIALSLRANTRAKAELAEAEREAASMAGTHDR